jgi:ABC-type nitrate/sulfonate/bicarbonate transport system permease component
MSLPLSRWRSSLQASQAGLQVLRALSLALFVILWLLAVKLEVVRHLASPVEALLTITKEFKQLLIHSLATISRGLGGFLIGSPIGVAMALAMAWSPHLNALFDPIVRFLRPLPLIALIPLFILWFGLREASKILYVATGCFFLVAIFAVEAIQNVPQIYLHAGQALGAKGLVLYRRIILPAILPGILGGLRVALVMSIQLAIASEFMGAQKGLGFYLLKSGIAFQVSRMIAAVVFLTLLTVVVDLLAQRIGRLLTPGLE